MYAWDAPEELGGVQYLIGTIVSTSPTMTSHWGDKKLFFRHHDMTFDLQKEPSWFDYTPSVGNVEDWQTRKSLRSDALAGGCPFAFLI